VVIRNTQDAEDTLKIYETRLRDVNKVPTDKKEVENYRSQLKVPSSQRRSAPPIGTAAAWSIWLPPFIGNLIQFTHVKSQS